jgi:hypothetical protein
VTTPATTPPTTTPITTIHGLTTPPPTTKPTSSTPTTITPTFELKELHSGLSAPTDSAGPYKKFFYTYLTNQSGFTMKFISPDGYFYAPFSIKGPGEFKDEAQIPPQDFYLNSQENKFLGDAGYVALPGTYKMVVYGSSYPTTVIYEKDFTYKGAKLAIQEASVNTWSWMWSWPVCEIFPKEISVSVSNNGDLPSFASVILSLDGKRMDFGFIGLGYVDAGSTRTFTFPSPYYMVVLNYKTAGDTVPPSPHAFSVDLVSRIPEPSTAMDTPAASTLAEYYNSLKCPYKKLSGTSFLLLDEYSITVKTPQVITHN